MTKLDFKSSNKLIAFVSICFASTSTLNPADSLKFVSFWDSHIIVFYSGQISEQTKLHFTQNGWHWNNKIWAFKTKRVVLQWVEWVSLGNSSQCGQDWNSFKKKKRKKRGGIQKSCLYKRWKYITKKETYLGQHYSTSCAPIVWTA